MKVAIVCKMEVIELGEFPDLATAHEIHGEQTELLGFHNDEELEEFRQTVADIRRTTELLEAAALMAGDYYTNAVASQYTNH